MVKEIGKLFDDNLELIVKVDWDTGEYSYLFLPLLLKKIIKLDLFGNPSKNQKFKWTSRKRHNEEEETFIYLTKRHRDLFNSYLFQNQRKTFGYVKIIWNEKNVMRVF